MKPPITNILFATDMSDNSTFALRHTASLAQITGAELHILHVSEALSSEARVTIQMFIQDKDERRKALSERLSVVKETLAKRQQDFWGRLPTEDKGIRDQIASIEVIEGHPAEAILRRAKDLKCDLIVLGAHDHGITHTFLGTVAKRVLRRAKIPTLIVPVS